MVWDPYGLLKIDARVQLARTREELARASAGNADRDFRRDLDETRRLCYMALVAGRADGRHDLCGTLINALIHHMRITTDREEVIEKVVGAVTGSSTDDEWLLRVIHELTATLNDPPRQPDPEDASADRNH